MTPSSQQRSGPFILLPLFLALYLLCVCVGCWDGCGSPPLRLACVLCSPLGLPCERHVRACVCACVRVCVCVCVQRVGAAWRLERLCRAAHGHCLSGGQPQRVKGKVRRLAGVSLFASHFLSLSLSLSLSLCLWLALLCAWPFFIKGKEVACWPVCLTIAAVLLLLGCTLACLSRVLCALPHCPRTGDWERNSKDYVPVSKLRRIK